MFLNNVKINFQIIYIKVLLLKYKKLKNNKKKNHKLNKFKLKKNHQFMHLSFQKQKKMPNQLFSINKEFYYTLNYYPYNF